MNKGNNDIIFDLKSQVESNQKLLNVNDTLIYQDSVNYQEWVVTELFEGGFEAKDDYENKDFYFNELQIGWSFKNKTIEVQ